MKQIKYKCDVVEKGSEKYFFITKRTNFTPEQISYIIEDIMDKESLIEKEPVQTTTKTNKQRFFRPVDSIFLADLKLGIEHCLQKYNVDIETFLGEARECFPSTDVEKLLGIPPRAKNYEYSPDILDALKEAGLLDKKDD